VTLLHTPINSKLNSCVVSLQRWL